jgi:glycine betaine/proline transport system substrate-binding protein
MKVTKKLRLLAGATALSVAAAGCSGGGTSEVVDIAVNPWVGYEANAAVVGYILENELGFTVEYKDLAEQVSWEGFATGEVDAIVENWGHLDLKQKYIDEEGVAVLAGSTGIDGIIGWFIPPWMAEQYPDIVDGANLNKYADLFVTSESGGKGQLLLGDPSFVTSDQGIINGLGLNYNVVYAGSEAALIEAFRKAEANRTPLIGYFYSPQWFLAEVPLLEVKLPAWTDGCDADPEKITCGYAPYSPLDKIISKSLEEKAPKAAQFIKNFQWTAAEQNKVAYYITNDGMTRAEAAKKWVEENEAVWKPWVEGL